MAGLETLADDSVLRGASAWHLEIQLDLRSRARLKSFVEKRCAPLCEEVRLNHTSPMQGRVSIGIHSLKQNVYE